jgi:hypothetical protein
LSTINQKEFDMSQAARKVTQDQPQEKLSIASETKRGSKSQEKSSMFGFDMLPGAMDVCSRLVGSSMEIHSDMFKALTECSAATVRACSSLSNELIESSNRSLSQLMELSKEAANCRTINAVIELQQKAAEHAIETCIDTTQKVSAQLHECCMETLNPLQEHAASISDKISKAVTPKE